MRKKLIAGNWKMNKTILESVELCEGIKKMVTNPPCDVVVCVPFTDLAVVKTVLAATKIKVGAQNVSWADKGAFTGEISAPMLKESGVDYVIVGHSERRAMFAETNESVFKRAKKALEYGLIPIVCIGESKTERENGTTNKVLKQQILGCLKDFSLQEIESVVIAYEPVWAIGTGLSATNQQAEDAICFIRECIQEMFGIGQKIRILYGGSMNAENAKGLLSMPNIDGGLIGGASLVAQDFAKIINSTI